MDAEWGGLGALEIDDAALEAGGSSSGVRPESKGCGARSMCVAALTEKSLQQPILQRGFGTGEEYDVVTADATVVSNSSESLTDMWRSSQTPFVENSLRTAAIGQQQSPVASFQLQNGAGQAETFNENADFESIWNLQSTPEMQLGSLVDPGQHKTAPARNEAGYPKTTSVCASGALDASPMEDAPLSANFGGMWGSQSTSLTAAESLPHTSPIHRMTLDVPPAAGGASSCPRTNMQSARDCRYAESLLGSSVAFAEGDAKDSEPPSDVTSELFADMWGSTLDSRLNSTEHHLDMERQAENARMNTMEQDLDISRQTEDMRKLEPGRAAPSKRARLNTMAQDLDMGRHAMSENTVANSQRRTLPRTDVHHTKSMSEGRHGLPAFSAVSQGEHDDVDEAAILLRCQQEGPPGPAGGSLALPGYSAEHSKLGDMSKGPPISESVGWLCALKFLKLPFDPFHLGAGGTSADHTSFLMTHNLAAVMRHPPPPRRWDLAVLVRRVELIAGEIDIIVADPTGEIGATVDRRVAMAWPRAACEGTVLLLTDVIAICGADLPCRLLIMEKNVAHHFTQGDVTPEQAESLIAEARASLSGMKQV
jgi:hypothetical protein